jgi:hypothetical protein
MLEQEFGGILIEQDTVTPSRGSLKKLNQILLVANQ